MVDDEPFGEPGLLSQVTVMVATCALLDGDRDILATVSRSKQSASFPARTYFDYASYYSNGVCDGKDHHEVEWRSRMK